METLNKWWDQASEMLGKLNGAPSLLLILFSCIGVGYGLRWIKRFPNNAIPIVVILWGGLFNLLIADTASIALRIWLGRNLLVGLIVGVASWALHMTLLKKLEKKFGWFEDTDTAKLEHETQVITKKNEEAGQTPPGGA